MKIARHHPLCIDLLHLDGKDLRQQTLLDRRAELHHLIGVDLESRIQFSEEFERSGLERRRKMPKKRLELSRSLRSCGRSRFCRARAKAWQWRARRPARRSRAITDTERNTVFLVLTRRSGSNGSRTRTTGLRSWLLIFPRSSPMKMS